MEPAKTAIGRPSGYPRTARLIRFIPIIDLYVIMLISPDRMKRNVSHPTGPGCPEVEIQEILSLYPELLSG
jgi:hypothetical protein